MRILKCTILLLLLSIIPYQGSNHPKTNTKFVLPPDLNRVQQSKILLEAHGLPQDWIRVFRTESGFHLTSGLATKGNNVMGMQYPRTRKTTAIGVYTDGLHARYASLDDCIKDLSIWVSLKPQQEGETFVQYLKRRRYNPNPAYYSYIMKLPID